MTRVQWSLFTEQAKPAPDAAPLPPLRKCATCDKLEAPNVREMVALGLWHCKLDGPATFRSTKCGDGSLRECDKGVRDGGNRG